jgi:hypothetical protein
MYVAVIAATAAARGVYIYVSTLPFIIILLAD